MCINVMHGWHIDSPPSSMDLFYALPFYHCSELNLGIFFPRDFSAEMWWDSVGGGGADSQEGGKWFVQDLFLRSESISSGWFIFLIFLVEGETQIEWEEEKESSVNKGKSRFRHPAIRGANDPWRIEKISRSVDLLPSKHSSRDIPSLTLVKL